MLKQSNNRKQQESKKLAADVEAFLASGGRITVMTTAPTEPKKLDKRMTVKKGWKNANDVFDGEAKYDKMRS